MADAKQQKKNKKDDVNAYSGKFVPKKKDPLRAFLPVLGLLIIGAAGAVAWFGSPFLLDWLFTQPYVAIPASITSTEPMVLAPGIEIDLLQLIIAILIFFIIVAIAALLYAMVAPRPTKLVQESFLMDERKQMEIERQRENARKRKMKSRMAKANKEKGSTLDDL